MKNVDIDRANLVLQKFIDGLPPVGLQLELLVLAERALTAAASWSAYAKPGGALHFDDAILPLSEALLALEIALRTEADGGEGKGFREEAARRLHGIANLVVRNPPPEFRSH